MLFALQDAVCGNQWLDLHWCFRFPMGAAVAFSFCYGIIIEESRHVLARWWQDDRICYSQLQSSAIQLSSGTRRLYVLLREDADVLALHA